MDSSIRRRLPYIALVAAVLVLDRWSKWMIDTTLSLNQTVTVIDGLFNITYVPNTGIAFGILNSASMPAKRMLFSLFAAAAALGVVIYSLRSPVSNRLLQVGLSLILAGALGNMYDRLAHGYVIDFLDFHFRSYHWPSFNVADSALVAGVGLLALEILRDDRTAKAAGRV
jgi:signal peptidase II